MLRQNWMAAPEKVGLRPRLPLGVRHFLRCLFFVSFTPSVYGARWGDLCNKALNEGKLSNSQGRLETAFPEGYTKRNP